MKKKIFFILFLSLFFFAFSPLEIKATVYEETRLVNNSNCWNFINNILQYDENRSGCEIERENITVEEGIYPSYCHVLVNNNVQVIMVFDRAIRQYVVMPWSPEGGKSEIQSDYTCKCSGEGDSRRCKYIPVVNSENQDEFMCSSKTVTYYLVKEDGSNEIRQHNGSFTQDGEETCKNDEGPIEICNRKKSAWEEKANSKCPEDKQCFNYKEKDGYGPMRAVCQSPNTNGDVCTEDGKNVKKANSFGYELKSLEEYFGRGSGCIECVNGDGQPVCKHSDQQIIGDCYQIDGRTVNNKSTVGHSICYNDSIYLCTENKKPDYSFKEECKDNTPKCQLRTDGHARCVTNEEYDKYDHYGISISTRSSDEFLCDAGNGINTAIGCIPITVDGLIEKLLPNIFGIAGGIALVMMIYGFIMISTSSGDEKKVAAAKQTITSAIIGLLVTLFALFLYRLIAVKILHIPGF